MADLYNKTNYLIYDPDNRVQSFIAKRLDADCKKDKIGQKEIFYMSYKELLPDYAGLKDEDYKSQFVFIVDFDLDDSFEAMDSSFQSRVSDKRVYYGSEALDKALAYSKSYKSLFAKPSLLKTIVQKLISRN